MNIQLGELHTGDKQTIVTAYLAMLQPMMLQCGSDKQNMQFDLIYRNLASGKDIDQENLLHMLNKVAELTSIEDEMINHYSKRIIKIVALGVKVFVDQSDAAFDLLIEELTKLIAQLNDAIVSLEDIIGENLSIIKKLEEKQGKIGNYMHAETLKGPDTDKQGRPKTYVIHSDLGKLFEEATESIIKILSERGMVNKQVYIDQVVFGVQRILKIPTAVIALQKRQEKSTVSDAFNEVAASVQTEEIALPDQSQAISDSPTNLGEGDPHVEKVLEEMDKESFLNTVKTFAEGSASSADMPMFYDVICKQQTQYKFTKAQQKQLTAWLEELEKLFRHESVKDME